jgi:hypothetical protein
VTIPFLKNILTSLFEKLLSKFLIDPRFTKYILEQNKPPSEPFSLLLTKCFALASTNHFIILSQGFAIPKDPPNLIFYD